jgi:carboxyl-terminal processing protease
MRTLRLLIVTALITSAIVGAFVVGMGTHWLMTHRQAPSEDAAEEFGLFWEAWNLVEDHYLRSLPDSQHLTWGAIRGAMGVLDDPYTVFLEPQPTQRQREDLSGKFGGIGAWVTQAEDGSIELDPMPDLPAAQAGVQRGDVVLRVDDTDVAGLGVDEVVTLVRGPVGEVVRLTLRRAGEPEPVVVEIERAEIPTPSVEWRMLEEAPGVGYVRIAIFTERTNGELERAVEELRAQGMERLVFDLRGNGGGLLDSSIDVASQFLRGGVVLYEQRRDGPETEYAVKSGGLLLDIPLVTLVDGGTASASEIVAGALQDRGRSLLVGEKTFGKGSVQLVFTLSDDSSVHITVAEWLTPSRRQISGQGLEPDAPVGISEEDRANGRDPQLERALELVVAGR